jgi:CO/xanthine dehydrogenase Mo-binding subunit
MINWDEKYPYRDMGNGKVRSVGVAMSMQGSGISAVDTGAVEIKVNDDGFYSLIIGATDMGTGCDTILAQMAAECLECKPEEVVVFGVDTDISPYDCGSYASSTTYVTGQAVVKTCESLRKKICERGAEYLGCKPEDVDFDGEYVTELATGKQISRSQIGNNVMCFSNAPLSASEAFSSPVSPPPFMVGMAEVEIDKETGVLELIDYVAVVDCGTVINPSLARVQVEGGIAQGIGMALYEDIVYSEKGKNFSNSLMQYKIPTRLDVGTIRVEFESSYEPTGPFGAKSIGEIVINTPSPAISNAIQNATGVIIRELPMTAEKIYRGICER